MAREYSEERFLSALQRVEFSCNTFRQVLLQRVVASGQGDFLLGPNDVKVDERFVMEALAVLIVQLVDESPDNFRYVFACAGAKWAEETGLFEEGESPEGKVS